MSLNTQTINTNRQNTNFVAGVTKDNIQKYAWPDFYFKPLGAKSNTLTPFIAKTSNLTGTISVTSGGNTITGSGTSFTELSNGIGYYIWTAGGQSAKISSINSDTSITIVGTWASTETGVTFQCGDSPIGGFQSNAVFLEKSFQIQTSNSDPIVNIYYAPSFGARVGATTTTTSSFTQPAVNSSTTVPVASVANIFTNQNIVIAGGGTYQVTAINTLTLTIKNLGFLNDTTTTQATVGATVTTGKGVYPIQTTTNFPTATLINDANAFFTPNNPGIIINTDTKQTCCVNAITRTVQGGPIFGYMFGNGATYSPSLVNVPGNHGGAGIAGGEITLAELTAKNINHAIAVLAWGKKYFDRTANSNQGFVDPAVKADSNYNNSGDANYYNGNIPGLTMGSQLAIPANVTPAMLGLTSDFGLTMLTCLQKYGAYIIDNSAYDAIQFDFTPDACNFLCQTTQTTASFVQPSVGNNVVISVTSTTNFYNQLNITINNGDYWIQSVDSGTQLTIRNMGGAQNAAPGATIASGTTIFTLLPTNSYRTEMQALLSALQLVQAPSGALPSQTGNSGKFLTTNGTSPSWGTVSTGVPVNVQAFTSSGTWTKPSGGQTVFSVYVIGGGGGGGSGREGAAGTARYGGGGGGGAAVAWVLNQALAGMPATMAVTVGAGGTGGAAQTTDNTNGNAGTAGGQSTFGGVPSIFAPGGNGGGGGSTTAGTAGSGGGGMISGSAGGAAGATNGANGGNNNLGGAAGGGSGGSISSGDVVGTGGGPGGNFLHTLGASPAGSYYPGGGSAGGAASLTGGISGTNGNVYGGGGGGGGAGLNGFNSGAGGNGGGGCVLVISW